MAAHGNGTTRLAQMLYFYRTMSRKSLRDLARETRISPATMMRIEHGHSMDVATFLKLQSWLFQRIGPAPRERRPQ